MKRLAPICFALLFAAACGDKKSTEASPPPAKGDTAAGTKTATAPAAPPAKAPPPAGASVLTERLLEDGARVPDFSMQAHDGSTVALSSIDGPLVLYFYPKDETPG